MDSAVAVLFGNLKNNIGDFALLHAVLLDLHSRFPNHSVDVYTHQFHPIDQRRLDAFRSSIDLPFEIAGETFSAKPGPKLLVSGARALGLWPAIQARLIGSLATQAADSAAKFSRYELVVIVGGAHWAGARLGISMFGTLSAVHSRNSHIYAYPFSVEGTVTEYNSRQALQKYFGMIQKPLIARDSISSETLNNLGIDNILGADSVFGLVDTADRVPVADRDRSRIIFALAAPIQKELRAVLLRLVGHGRQVVLMTTCQAEDERRVRPLANEFRVEYLAPDTWQEAVSEMKASALVVSNRLHGLIFASLADTPVLPVSNRQKSKAFAEDTAVPHNAVDLYALTPDLIECCIAERQNILSAVRRYRDRSKERVISPFSTVLRPPV